MSDLFTEVETKEKLKPVELTEEQKTKILTEWNTRIENPPSMKELIMLVFSRDYGVNTVWGRAIKAFLASRELKTVSTRPVSTPVASIELKPEQKEYIVNNCEQMSCVEMAKTLFNNPSLFNVSAEARMITKYVQSLTHKTPYGKPNETPDGDYSPPIDDSRTLVRIKKYVDGCEWELDKVTAVQKKCLKSLRGYLRSYRFCSQINSFDKKSDRNLFESSLIKWTYEKYDLLPEEVDQYIILATEVVMSSSIQLTITNLQREQDETLANSGKLSLYLVEAVKVARDEYNSSVKRQQALFKSLTEERSERLKDKIKDNASILNLVQIWKSHEGRKRMISLADKRKDKLKENIEELTNIDDLKARIMGLSNAEALN